MSDMLTTPEWTRPLQWSVKTSPDRLVRAIADEERVAGSAAAGGDDEVVRLKELGQLLGRQSRGLPMAPFSAVRLVSA